MHPKTVKVGILHSLTGTMALSNLPLVDAELMAIAEINARGGVLGRQIEPVVVDPASNPDEFSRKARKLLQAEQVATVFGCWTSLSRKSVLPVFEALNGLLWYPVQYEGLEQSPHIFYTGSCPNQQVEPAVQWLLDQDKQRFFLVGSDYVFPRTVNKIIKGNLRQVGGTAVGEAYTPLGATDFTAILAAIQRAQPDVIFNSLNGDSNLAFYHQYQAAGWTADRLPIMAVSIAEAELQRIGTAATGHYACWSYFQSLDTPENRTFVRHFQQRYGSDRVVSDPIATAYTQVYLWRQAVEAAQSFASDRVRQAACGQEFLSPLGRVRLDANHHLWKQCHIGRILPTGQFEPMTTVNGLMKPLPWLGVEESTLPTAGTVIELLGDVSQGVQYSWELEQQSRALEQALKQLQAEIAQRQEAERALQQANAEISALNQRLQTENLRMRAELDVTRQLQQLILPKEEELNLVDGLDIAGFMQPADEVGGDYYDILQGNGNVKIAIGDVTGHGLESGMVMLMVQTAVRTLLESNETDASRFLDTLNRTIYGNVRRMQTDKNLTLQRFSRQRSTV